MKKKTRAEFIEEVRVEIEHIKAKATWREKNKLDFSKFSVNSPWNCIYGLMTGDCRSARAKKLYPKTYACTGKLAQSSRIPFSNQDFEQIDGANHFTPLEKYLFMVKKPTHQNIIAYLKGEVETLELV
jgi:hypothetical protein